MIAKDDMMAALLAACPSFEPNWRNFLADWQSEPDEPPLYVALGDFAGHLRDMLERGETESLPAGFQAIERLHIEGDSYVKEAVTIGVLESLQNATDPDRFRRYLGPESERWWDKLNRFWNGDATALGE